jgi:DNA-directed RNA polymerase subunit alpha
MQCLESKTLESGACYGKFAIDFLEVNQGVTIGNQLRRVLLGELGGIAISAVRIAGVANEFSTISGVREDVLEILLNLKGIVVKSKTKSKTDQIARLKIGGPRVITADLIELPSDLELVNPTHYIATIATSNVLEMEFKFQYGTSYQLASPLRWKNEDNYLPIDSLFMPIQKVNFQVESVYEALENSHERLVLEIFTNGSLSPHEAIQLASERIIEVFTSLMVDPTQNNTFDLEKNSVFKPIQPYHNVTIEELHLSVRAYNCLKKAEIHTIGDLLKYSPQKLSKLKNFGQKSADEVFLNLKEKLNISLI